MDKRNYAKDITEIATKLDGKVEFSAIAINQMLICEPGESINNLLFIDKKFGLWFYTSRADFDNLCYLKGAKFPTYVVCSGSKCVYEIK